MKHVCANLAMVTVILCLTISCSSRHHSEKKIPNNSKNIKLSKAWARPGSKGGNSAVYLKIKNSTNKADTLLRISSEVAEKVALHQSYTENGMSGMRPVGKKQIPSGTTLQLQPGGYHIMLIKLNRQLSQGDSVRLTLHFSTSGAQQLNVPVKLPQ